MPIASERSVKHKDVGCETAEHSPAFSQSWQRVQHLERQHERQRQQQQRVLGESLQPRLDTLEDLKP